MKKTDKDKDSYWDDNPGCEAAFSSCRPVPPGEREPHEHLTSASDEEWRGLGKRPHSQAHDKENRSPSRHRSSPDIRMTGRQNDAFNREERFSGFEAAFNSSRPVPPGEREPHEHLTSASDDAFNREERYRYYELYMTLISCFCSNLR